MPQRRYLVLGAPLLVVACSNPPVTAPQTLSAAFATPDTMGQFDIPLVASDDIQGTVAGRVAYATGRDANDGHARAMAGLLPGLTVAIPPPGSAIYDATFEGAIVEDIVVANGQLSGRNNPLQGDITLTADFPAGTLRGYGDSLRVDADLTGTAIDGTITYRDMAGQITGLAGGDGITAAFVGQGDDAVFAGGIVGTTAP